MGVEVGTYSPQEWQRAVETWKANPPDEARSVNPSIVAEYQKKYAASSFLQEVLPILNAVERTLAALPPEPPNNDNAGHKGRRGGKADRKRWQRRDPPALTSVTVGNPVRDELARGLLRLNPTLTDEDIRLELESLDCRGARVFDFSPLARQPIVDIWLDTPEGPVQQVLRSMPRLRGVNGVGWQRW
jgi:hypothetical protein